MNRLCGGVGGRAGLGGRGGCEEELKTVVYFVVAVCVKVEKIGGMAACGEAAGADLWRGGGQGFERVDLWRGGVCQGLRE